MMANIMNSIDSNRELLLRFKRGDKSAFSRFYRQHADGLYFYFSSMVSSHDLAADLMQELAVQLCNNLERFIEAKDVQSYMYASARNLVANARRAQSRYEHVLTHVPQQPALAPQGVEPWATRENAERVSKSLLELELEERELVILHIYEGLSFAQLEVILEIAKTTLFDRYEKVMIKLKAKLKNF